MATKKQTSPAPDPGTTLRILAKCAQLMTNVGELVRQHPEFGPEGEELAARAHDFAAEVQDRIASLAAAAA